jgi:hypothetical protein
VKALTLLSAGVVAVCTLASCSGTLVALGPHGNLPPVTGTPRVVDASACGFQLLLFIPININDRMERAYKKLQQSAEGQPIVDIEVRERWTYWLVGTGYCTELRAKALSAR